MQAHFRRVLPTAVMVAAGAIVLLGQFADIGLFRSLRLPELSAAFINWAAILFAFAMILGLLNLLAVHWRRVRERDGGWTYSGVLIATVFVVLCAGLNGVNAPSLQWIFRNVQAPLQATLLSLTVFFLVSASLRAIRTRSPASILMLLIAAIVLLGQMPFAERLSIELSEFQRWILEVPAVAGQRGIMLGVALGTVATGLRILLGVERERFFH
jgi:membrane-associated HD superfamily phosphohydrolase